MNTRLTARTPQQRIAVAAGIVVLATGGALLTGNQFSSAGTAAAPARSGLEQEAHRYLSMGQGLTPLTSNPAREPSGPPAWCNLRYELRLPWCTAAERRLSR